MSLSQEGGLLATGKIASGLYVVTTGLGAQGTGYLASWVQQVSFEPMLIAICVNATRPIVQTLLETGSFAVNVLGPENMDLMKHFAKGFPPGALAFEGIDFDAGQSGVPILRTAFASIECEVLQTSVQPGDHIVLFGKVVQGEVRGTGRPQVHIRRSGKDY